MMNFIENNSRILIVIFSALILAIVFSLFFCKNRFDKFTSKVSDFLSDHPISIPFVFLITVIVVALSIIFFRNDLTEKENSLLSGLIVGLFTLIISIIINYSQLKSIDLFKKLKIKYILKSRSDPNYYYPIIDRADQYLWVLGVTASRLLNDFLEPDSKEENKKILMKKIEKGLTIKLLLPEKNKKFLPKDEHYKNHDITIGKLKALDIQIKKSIEVRLYSNVPSHSIFYTENECIVGPIFPNVDSKNTPAIHLEDSSLYAEEYLKYFHEEWKIATIVDLSS